MDRLETRRIVLSGMFIALVVVSTFINIPYPGSAGGLMHLGTLMLIIISLKFGKHYGALAGGIGMGLFDILGGWMAWAPGTIVVRLLMGYVIGLIAEDKAGQGSSLIKNIIAIICGAIVMITGYYFYEAIFLTTFKAALLSINGNIAQILIGFLGLLIIPLVQGIENLNDN
ncbi:MAG: ECF transporter S component [Firmicutes bacterium]|nr:ECF transporter S component [Bacillota bacterium]